MKLREGLQSLLAGWRGDISERWSTVLAGVEPDFGAVDDSLELGPEEVIFPGRKGQAPLGARPDSCIFRALDGIEPDDVGVVVIGQDPYTHVAQATGRSFEQGDLTDWYGRPRVSPSLQRIVQAVALARTGDRRYADGAGAWQLLVGDLRTGQLAVPASRELWDGWQAQGVLFVNAILTFNRFDPRYQFGGHQPLWRPVVKRLLVHLASRAGRPMVFVAWGGKAGDALAEAGVEAAAKAAGTWGKTVTVVKGPHPNAPPASQPPFLHDRDPLRAVNQAVAQVAGEAVRW